MQKHSLFNHLRRFSAFLSASLYALLILAGGAVPTLSATNSDAAKINNSDRYSTADHSKFKELQGPFHSGSEVTRACLACHTEASRQLMKTRHWTWDYVNPDTGQRLGKKTMLNAFCIGDQSNEPFCNACHIGYGWKDAHFDFKDQGKVDCLVCHHSGGYSKPSGLAGETVTQRTEYPPASGKFFEPVDLAKIAQSIGKTRTNNCGSCHYKGGGGDGVKHGDLDSSLDNAEPWLDVHMASKEKGGAGFSCATCHKTSAHEVSGSRISVTAADPHPPAMRGASNPDRNAATCQNCHGDKPHRQNLLQVDLLNGHAQKLACQSCHIPAFARGGVPTKMAWDWSAAGRMGADGKPIQTRDAQGHVIYDSRKGDFTLGENVVPDYVWFNGKVLFTTQETKIDPTQKVAINTYLGDADDADARIWPVKRFVGKQPFDPVHKRMLVPHVAVPNDSAYWFNFDWPRAIQAGAAATGYPYSGEFDFVETEMLWPITHMVAPAKDAVRCGQCHSRDGRLQQVSGIYLPARDRHFWIDATGWTLAALSLFGVLVHALIRILTHRKTASGEHHA